MSLLSAIGLALLAWSARTEPASKASLPEAPLPCPGAALVYDANLGDWVGFGGRDVAGPVSHLWRFDRHSRRWVVEGVDPRSPLPPPRALAGAVLIDGGERLLVFGGEDDRIQARDDSWIYDFASHWWWQVTPIPGDQNPDPRVNANLTYYAKVGSVLLTGGQAWGRGGGRFHDAWELCLDDMRWTRIW